MISSHFSDDLTILPLSLREGIQSSSANFFMLIECVHVIVNRLLCEWGGERHEYYFSFLNIAYSHFIH